MEGRSRNDHREIAHRLRNPRVEIQRGTSGQIIWGAVVGTTRARGCSRKKPSDLSLGAPCGGERWIATPARDWRKTSSRIRRHVHLEPGQVRSADGLGAIAQRRMARNQPEAVGWVLEVLGLGLGAAAYRGIGRGFRAGAASKSIHGSAWKNRAPCLSRGAGDLGAAKDRVNRFGIRIARFRQSLKWIRNGSEGISEIKFDGRTESRQEAARRRASRVE